MANDPTRELVLTAFWEALEGGSYDAGKIRETLADDSHLVDDLGLDSLDLVEFYMRLEELFETEIPNAEFEKLSTIGAIASYLSARGAAPADHVEAE